jgi:hypothetical protein
MATVAAVGGGGRRGVGGGRGGRAAAVIDLTRFWSISIDSNQWLRGRNRFFWDLFLGICLESVWNLGFSDAASASDQM